MSYELTLVALADPTRRTLFERVKQRPYTVGELARYVQVRQPTVSQHLRVLRQARLVSDRRGGARPDHRASSHGRVALRREVGSLGDGVVAASGREDPPPPS